MTAVEFRFGDAERHHPIEYAPALDAMGRVSTIVDPNALATYIYYDSLGRAIQTQQPHNTGSSVPTVIQLGYDLNDSLTSVIDPRSLTTRYSVTGLGTSRNQTSPDSGASQYTYDAKGNLLTSTDARGKASVANLPGCCMNAAQDPVDGRKRDVPGLLP